jgi:hypothetical protein
VRRKCDIAMFFLRRGMWKSVFERDDTGRRRRTQEETRSMIWIAPRSWEKPEETKDLAVGFINQNDIVHGKKRRGTREEKKKKREKKVKRKEEEEPLFALACSSNLLSNDAPFRASALNLAKIFASSFLFVSANCSQKIIFDFFFQSSFGFGFAVGKEKRNGENDHGSEFSSPSPALLSQPLLALWHFLLCS